MTPIRLGTIEAHEKLTAKLYVQPYGESGYVDLGNMADYKDAQERQYRQHNQAKLGARFVDDDQLDTIHRKWEFTTTETGEFSARLLGLSSAATLVTQALVSAPSGTATVASVVLGRTYDLGAVALDTVVVKVSSVTMPPSDYTLDADNGLITVHEDAAVIVGGNQLDITFGNALRYSVDMVGRTQVLFRGSIRLEETSQLSPEPLRTTTFTGVITVGSFPEQTGEFGKSVLRVTATDVPVVVKRNAA